MNAHFPLLLCAGDHKPRVRNGQCPTATTSGRPVADSVTVTVRWNRLMPKFATEAAANRRAARAAASAAGDSAALRRIAGTGLPMTFNSYPLVSVAQYRALSLASENGRASTTAAVASASALILTEAYKDSAVRASIAGELKRDLDRSEAEFGRERTSAGKTLGEDVARRMIGSAPVLEMVTPLSGTVPTGAGMWYSAQGIPPIGTGLAKSRTWVLDSTSQFRPAPPPAFGSQPFNAAVEEVQRFARERTAVQTEIAQRWNAGDPMVIWNAKAAEVLRRHAASESRAARVLAVMNAAAVDAAIACFDAKYYYWTIRPSQVDTALKLAENVALPNFPSYPSGHACSAGALEGVLTLYFPAEAAEFKRMAEEQAMSRLYAGVHYRFDNEIGLDLGRIVAHYAVEREKNGKIEVRRKRYGSVFCRTVAAPPIFSFCRRTISLTR